MSEELSQSELRHDPIQKRWVIIAASRSGRPDSFSMASEELKDDADCPFCEGNESLTPPEIIALRENGGADEPG
ncbi:MAG: galactose-1-phosphate uridylyltransferase, partial [Gemmatimonadetes bacterium]|nr:galactose-1-phosphate uridylyltransferase [Gemmatimonadota bacterium]